MAGETSVINNYAGTKRVGGGGEVEVDEVKTRKEMVKSKSQ